MKKMYSLLFLLITFTIFAEGNSSLLSGNTFGLFRNALDGAFEVNENGTSPNFSTLSNPYIFGGLTNFDFQAATTESEEEQEIPFILGYYHPGKLPSSYLFKLRVKSAGNEGIINGNILTETALVTDTSEAGIESESNWITEESNQVFSVGEALDLKSNFQFIIHSGLLNMGTLLSFDYSRGELEAPLSWAESNREITTLYNYDKMAGTPPPQAALDYTKTESWINPDSDIKLGIDLPFYIEGRNLGHFINLGFTYSQSDDSYGHHISYSDPVSTGPAEAFSETDSSYNDILKGIDISAAYTLTLPALFPSHRNNFTELSTWFNYRINIADDKIETSETREYETNMAQDPGSRNLLLSRSLSTTTSTLTLADSYNGGLAFRMPMYFGLSDATVFGISPSLSLAYENTPLVDPEYQNYKDYIVTNSEITSLKTDSDGDAVFEQTIITTKTLNSDGQGLAHIGSASFKLPMVIRIKQDKWPFEFTLASQIELGTDLHWTADRYDTEKTVVETLDSTGTLTNTTTSQESGIVASTSNRFWTEWQFRHTNKLGFTLRFPRYVTLDIVLNSSNLFDFDNLTVQTIIALP